MFVGMKIGCVPNMNIVINSASHAYTESSKEIIWFLLVGQIITTYISLIYCIKTAVIKLFNISKIIINMHHDITTLSILTVTI